MSMKVAIVGGGNVGTRLARSLVRSKKAEVKIGEVPRAPGHAH